METSSRIFQESLTLDFSIYFLSLRMASSLPACPMNSQYPASLPAATAWLAPFPPLAVMYLEAWMVSPGTGM